MIAVSRMFRLTCKFSFSFFHYPTFPKIDDAFWFNKKNLLILFFVSFPHVAPMNDYLLSQYYFLSHSNCLDIVNFSLLLETKMNNFPASVKAYHCISHSILYLVLCLLKFVYVHNFNYNFSANSYKMMTTYKLLHYIKLLCPKHLEYTVAFLCTCLAKFLCAHLGSQF